MLLICQSNHVWDCVPFPDGFEGLPAIHPNMPFAGSLFFRLLDFGGATVNIIGLGPGGPPGTPGGPGGTIPGGPRQPAGGGGGGPALCAPGGALWPMAGIDTRCRPCSCRLRGRSRGIPPGPSGGPLGSGIGHMCIVIDQSGSIIVSQTCGRMISPFGPMRS